MQMRRVGGSAPWLAPTPLRSIGMQLISGCRMYANEGGRGRLQRCHFGRLDDTWDGTDDARRFPRIASAIVFRCGRSHPSDGSHPDVSIPGGAWPSPECPQRSISAIYPRPFQSRAISSFSRAISSFPTPRRSTFHSLKNELC